MLLIKLLTASIFSLKYATAFYANGHKLGVIDKFQLDTYNSTTDELDVFQATNEFRLVKEGQHIPPGLHVKIDMQTGQRWAKLVDTNEQGNYHNELVIKDDDIIEHNEAREAPKLTQPEKEEIYVPSDYRIAVEELNSFIKEVADGDVSKSDVSEKLSEKLEEFEDWVHDIKAGYTVSQNREFLGHLLDLSTLTKSWPKESSVLAARIIGSAFQNNPYVHDSDVDASIIPRFLEQLESESDQRLASAYIYAISSLVRANTALHKEFQELQGISLLRSIFGKNWAVDRKIINLVVDFFDPSKTYSGEAVLSPRDKDDVRSWCAELNNRRSEEDLARSTKPEFILEALENLKTNYPHECTFD
ncbi:nucleotide exchange factor sil1 [Mycoemilia scoparia]|uniref:Nucleotide exchange factor SIL1 n=1 Tax=Mycoemilia scoparia TaxID=417184 RepID=A0A9W8A8D5_9FUNG|nr:nucleotide exchange factor sil1 [Mycoemilia scoparia]